MIDDTLAFVNIATPEPYVPDFKERGKILFLVWHDMY